MTRRLCITVQRQKGSDFITSGRFFFFCSRFSLCCFSQLGLADFTLYHCIKDCNILFSISLCYIIFYCTIFYCYIAYHVIFIVSYSYIVLYALYIPIQFLFFRQTDRQIKGSVYSLLVVLNKEETHLCGLLNYPEFLSDMKYL